jgi:hypothetical protein
MEPTIERQIDDLTQWTRNVKAPLLEAKRAANEKKAEKTASNEKDAEEIPGAKRSETDGVTLTTAALR